jgi:hypothetical protein
VGRGEPRRRASPGADRHSAGCARLRGQRRWRMHLHIKPDLNLVAVDTCGAQSSGPRFKVLHPLQRAPWREHPGSNCYIQIVARTYSRHRTSGEGEAFAARRCSPSSESGGLSPLLLSMPDARARSMSRTGGRAGELASGSAARLVRVEPTFHTLRVTPLTSAACQGVPTAAGIARNRWDPRWNGSCVGIATCACELRSISGAPRF